MKLLISLTFIFISYFSFTQFSPTPGVLDAHTVSDKYMISHEGNDVSGLIRDEITRFYRKDLLVLTENQKKEINYYLYPNQDLVFRMPYCYLYYNDDNWAKRVIREVNISEPSNYCITKGEKRIIAIKETDKSISVDSTFDINKSLMSILRADIEKDDLTLYKYIDFVNHSYDSTINNSFRKHVLSKWDVISKIKLKEDWYYDKVLGDFKSKIIGFGLVIQENGIEKDLCWIYYPELRWTLKNEAITIPFYGWTTWDKLIENQLFDSEISYSDNCRNRMIYGVDYVKSVDYSDHRTDFDALWEIQLIKEMFRKNDKYFSHTYSQYYGVLDGTIKSYHEDKSNSVEVDFKNNIPHGKYKSYWKNGQLKEKGEFNFGLKEGKWITYFENGQKMNEKQYHKGWLDGQQDVWYKNGVKHLEYYYEDFKINKEFTRWDTEGVIMEQGYFKNNYMDSLWTINLRVPEIYQSIIKNNPELEWSKVCLATEDGVVSYTVLLKQINDKKYCPFNTCVKIVEYSEFK